MVSLSVSQGKLGPIFRAGGIPIAISDPGKIAQPAVICALGWRFMG